MCLGKMGTDLWFSNNFNKVFTFNKTETYTTK